jgi:cell wall-associated NlpC family hydrolase
MKIVMHALEKHGVVMGPADQEYLRGKARRFFRLKDITSEGVQKILAEAKTWLRTPYHAHAQVKRHGVDCAQFIAGVAVGAGLIPDPQIRKDYSVRVPKGTEYIDTILKYCDEITEAEAAPGDIAMFKTELGWMHSSIIMEWK